MVIKYKCRGNSEMKLSSWEGTMVPINLTVPYEVEVSARGNSFHLIIGSYKYGNYLCIPKRNIGTEIATLVDRYWNYERLTQYTDLSEVDAWSVVDALVELRKHIL